MAWLVVFELSSIVMLCLAETLETAWLVLFELSSIVMLCLAESLKMAWLVVFELSSIVMLCLAESLEMAWLVEFELSSIVMLCLTESLEMAWLVVFELSSIVMLCLAESSENARLVLLRSSNGTDLSDTPGLLLLDRTATAFVTKIMSAIEIVGVPSKVLFCGPTGDAAASWEEDKRLNAKKAASTKMFVLMLYC
jgi:glycerol uptake facilitator-like aquaporin